MPNLVPEVSVGIHAFVKNAKNQDILLTRWIENRVTFMQETAVARADFIHGTPHFRIITEQLIDNLCQYIWAQVGSTVNVRPTVAVRRKCMMHLYEMAWNISICSLVNTAL